ncbi:ABC-F family ATP-binding cassette domain-containing protein [Streptomyces avidinii]|uniref:Macrolide transport system ATP-binding/permease protein n=1 Tax=Streptomyces avidinii TaxID=1895 RepID=A0ABS4L4A7_STRAV|nr:ATP-binding cassette domain-containing protein [Streptomyces avidinii]MBP2036937.1 macrolide transport system ATP-binding/permease protein [Streptomyces avidinii]GGY94036.1 ABC transporter ATP-binding protein [Streptomyces avidinii]
MRAPLATTRIVLSEVTKSYDTRVVLERVSCTVRPGERVGVVGDNGSGKSTLLGLLAGRERPDHGEVTVTAPGGLGHLAQTLDLPPTARVGEAIDLALADLRALECRIRAAETRLHRAGPEELVAYGDLLAAYDARGGGDAERRVRTTLYRLGERGAPDPDRRLGTLSGGQRSRLALAVVLAAEPELLLLDEPTNDLDDEAVAWLEEHLLAHRGTVVAVTHDRLFLDRVTTAILEVDQDRRTVHRYGNGYAGHRTARAAERARREREYEQWREEVHSAERLADTNIGRFAAIPRKLPRGFSGAGAFRARSRTHGAASRIRTARERLHRLTEHPVPPPPRPLVFTGRFTEGAAGAVEIAGAALPGRLPPVSLTLAPGERLLVTGANGAGKSTLLHLLAGELKPAQGSVRTPARVGLLRQDDPWQRELRSVVEVFGPEYADRVAGYGLLAPADLARPVRELSAGQRRKLELARLVERPLDLLLLDEPTNHLAPAVVEELEAALAHFGGTLILVTHDRRLRAAFPGRRLELQREPAAASR